MDKITTHPMPLGDIERPEPRRQREPRRSREPLSWADDVSRPWSETMPAPDPADVRRATVMARTQRLARWGLAATVLGAALYALRWMLRS